MNKHIRMSLKNTKKIKKNLNKKPKKENKIKKKNKVPMRNIFSLIINGLIFTINRIKNIFIKKFKKLLFLLITLYEKYIKLFNTFF